MESKLRPFIQRIKQGIKKKKIVANAEFLTDQSPIVNLFAGKFEAFNLSGMLFPLFGIAFLFFPVTEFPSFMKLAAAFA